MKSLFDQTTYEEIVSRMNQLTAASQQQWGKMDVAQMLAHCEVAFKVPLNEKPMPRMLIGVLLGWLFKKKLYDEKPWKKNLPTAPDFIIKDSRNFENEKARLLALVERFHKADPSAIEKVVHPMFGKFTGEQWGKSMYKHLDHHLTQFGV